MVLTSPEPRESNLPEVYRYSTLEACDRQPKSVARLNAVPDTRNQENGRNWWRRHLGLLLLLALVIVGGAIGGGVGGALAAERKKNNFKAGRVAISSSSSAFFGSPSTFVPTLPTTREVRTSDSSMDANHSQTSSTFSQSTMIESSPTASSPSSSTTTSTTPIMSTISTTSTTSTTSTSSTEGTAAALPTPNSKIYLGEAKGGNSQGEQIAYLADGKPSSPCAFVSIVSSGTNPCERPFTLSDGVTYTWHGCGGETWVTWGNNQVLGECTYSPESRRCSGFDVAGNWLCG
ncbi:hypothetical protein FQN57_001682 [Myotisia sp. PD_48]|nr:hypothetical protein FQN57_001682 [Myotisia sp. PD_48]